MAKPPPPTRDVLDGFLPAVARWFRETYGTPTPPQVEGWPSIASGQNTLIFAPTGSGKTLAAFLACLDLLWRSERPARGVRVLYVSPLKALNQDISRNLEAPLAGILETATAAGETLRPLSVGVRSGDTSPRDRQRMARRPPEILITTPESLHILLTSRARESLRTVTHVIVDEIHAVCANKRGVFLALLLERLEGVAERSFLRIGLSATQRPLDEVARYLGGLAENPEDAGREPIARPVAIVDCGRRKQLDLEVVAPFGHPTAVRAGSVWPAIEDQLCRWIASHRSTLIFANNRRVAERLTARINERIHEAAPLDDEPTAPTEPLARSHHGSLSLDQRRSTEEALKAGELSAVVATASLELGIDMGAVDLVCQVESPGSVSRGLQRVGRAGHVVGAVSKGRFLAKTAGDLLETAALCRMMDRGAVEELRVPTNCLDVLAQQVVACVAMDVWSVSDLYGVVRRAYPYRDLSPAAFEGVLKMVSGRFPTGAFRDLRARVSWDRVHQRLAPLPGTQKLAVVGGGTIPDTGHYPVYLGEGGPRLGELDEEFVLERRVGETFVLGTATWRIASIDPLRVVVERAEGHSAVMPFWRGEAASRTAELGEAVGRLTREVAERATDPGLVDWLRQEYRLERRSAGVLRDYVARQSRLAGVVPDDRTILVEAFRDPAGETGLAVLTPFGGKLHQALKLVLQAWIRQRLGIEPAALHGDEGVLLRLPQTDQAPLGLLDELTPDRAEALILDELRGSALFGLRFRQNAGRALLMPRPDPSKRTPLWLQRLRAKDLLQIVGTFPDFPIVVETFRECLEDDLDLPRLRRLLEEVGRGTIRVATRRGETPSPFVSELLFRFEHQFLYEWDEPRRANRQAARPGVDGYLLDELLTTVEPHRWLDPDAVGRVDGRLQGRRHPPRTIEEAAELLRQMGDLAPAEVTPAAATLLDALEASHRARRIDLGRRLVEPERWVSAEDHDLYRTAFPAAGSEGDAAARDAARAVIVRRYLRTHALVGLDELTRRYPLDPADATDFLERFSDQGGLVRIDPGEGDDPVRWSDPANFQEVRRISIALKRKESLAVRPEVYADFLLRWQGVHPETRREGAAALGLALEQLQGYAASVELWEAEILPARVRDYRPVWLDDLLSAGRWYWVGGDASRGEGRLAFLARETPLPLPGAAEPAATDEDEQRLVALLDGRGACFATDLARLSGLPPSRVRSALQRLAWKGLVTNDRFDVLRFAHPASDDPAPLAVAPATAPRLQLGRPRGFRRPATERPEGRWSRVLPSAESTSDEKALAWAEVLLNRYGVLTRETAALDVLAPSWKDLASVLAGAELRGEVRRGYFVEGLSGVQYASDEAAEALVRAGRAADAGTTAEPVLLGTLDPANLYGSGAPLDVELLEGGTVRLPRNPSNWIVLIGGRPILVIEGHGRRLTGLASASEAELRAAIALLPRLARPPRRVLKVESYNGAATLASPSAPWLSEVGFVRDYPGMAYYPGW